MKRFYVSCAFLLFCIAQTAGAATAVATVSGTRFYGVGIDKDVESAKREAVYQCEMTHLTNRGRCEIAAATEESGGGAIIEAPAGIIFSLAATTEMEAVNAAFAACTAKYKHCRRQASISWLEMNGALVLPKERPVNTPLKKP